MTPFRLTALAVAVLAVAGDARAASEQGVRLHATVVLADRGGVAVRELRAWIVPRAGRLVVRVTGLVGRRDGTGATHAFVQVGACTGGTVQAPSCPPSSVRKLSVGIGVAPISLTVTVPRPTAVSDAIEVAITPDGRAVHAPTEHALLILPAAAWTPTNAGTAFGAVYHFGSRLDLRSFRADVVSEGLLTGTTVQLRLPNPTSSPIALEVDAGTSRAQRATVAAGTMGVLAGHDHHRMRTAAPTVPVAVLADGTPVVTTVLPRPAGRR